MAITKIGLNLNATQNWTAPPFNSTKTGLDYLREMPDVVNQATNYYFGWGMLITLFIILYTRHRKYGVRHRLSGIVRVVKRRV